MKYYTVSKKEINGNLVHIRAFFKLQDAQEHLEFFSKNSKEEFVITEHLN